MKSKEVKSGNILINTMAWGAMLWVILPDIIYSILLQEKLPYPIIFQVYPLLILAVFGFLWHPLRSLKWYFFALAYYLVSAHVLKPCILSSQLWIELFFHEQANTAVQISGAQLLRLSEAALLAGILLLAGFSRQELYLTLGDLKAPATSDKLLNVKEGDSWQGIIATIAPIVWLVTMVILYFMMKPKTGQFIVTFQQIHLIFLNASVNAIYEEFISRAVLFCLLVPVIGRNMAISIAVVFFGLGHYSGGYPNGISGVIMASFLAYLLGKCILETRGLLYAYVVHMVLDVIIFSYLAMR